MDKLALSKTLFTRTLIASLILIFGGCCSNVYALESITHRLPKCGVLITFAQFVGVSIGAFINFSTTTDGREALWDYKVPLTEYMKIVGFHFAVAVLNNTALAYKISVPVHIMFRSGGPMVTLLLAWLFFGRKYTSRQISAVALLTLGVICSTASGRHGTDGPIPGPPGYGGFALGVTSMILAQFMASAMGLYLERTFRSYGPSWRETLFFTHVLALPFFLPFASTIWWELQGLLDSEPFLAPDTMAAGLVPFNPPILLVYLFLNVFTQYLCVSGVNQLASSSSALSVSIVLNLRKFISLVLSYCVFGHRIDMGMVCGATFVFIGAAWYSQESSYRPKINTKNSNINLVRLHKQSNQHFEENGQASPTEERDQLL